jgi:hypothetical protein
MEAFEHRKQGQTSAAALTTEQLIAKATNTPLNKPVIPSLAAHNNQRNLGDDDGDDGEDDGDDYVEPVDTSKPRNKVGTYSCAVLLVEVLESTRVVCAYVVYHNCDNDKIAVAVFIMVAVASTVQAETAEEKRARKAALKDERRERRASKKATKMAFTAETNRQLTSQAAARANLVSLN